VAEPIGDDESFRRGLAESRAALGRARPRPRPVPDPAVVDDAPETDVPDDRDDRIAALEAENRRLRAALARIHRESGTALDR
jgi:hypothetical protein